MKHKTDWLAVAQKLEKFSDAIPERGAPKVAAALKALSARSDAAPKRKSSEPTLADDYPEAWRELQKRRRAAKWGELFLYLAVAMMVATRLSDYWLRAGQVATGEAALLQFFAAMIPMAIFAALNFPMRRFRCPRCGKPFFYKGFSDEAQPRRYCRHCQLRIGEPHR